jgi:putative SOS response-associated peptidase YedK
MCNRYGYANPYAAVLRTFERLGTIRWNGSEPNAPRLQIRPTDPAPVIRSADDGDLELVELRWGLIPWFHKTSMKEFKGLNTNARSETVGTLASFKGPYAKRRALIPATQYFEWTTNPENPKGRKLMWRFTLPDHETFALAGLWERAHTADGPVESFTFLTSEPRAAQRPYHDRQPVVLRPEQWAEWMDPANDMAPTFTAETATAVLVERFIELEG